MFSENAVEYLRNGECYSFQTFVIVFSTPENLLVGISGALGMNIELILTTTHQFWGGVDLLADLPELNSSLAL